MATEIHHDCFMIKEDAGYLVKMDYIKKGDWYYSLDLKRPIEWEHIGLTLNLKYPKIIACEGIDLYVKKEYPILGGTIITRMPIISTLIGTAGYTTGLTIKIEARLHRRRKPEFSFLPEYIKLAVLIY